MKEQQQNIKPLHKNSVDAVQAFQAGNMISNYQHWAPIRVTSFFTA
jgi:hypothetical protein